MIRVEGLRKTYGDLVAVDGVDFAAEPGMIFGLLGPNGAGKSTTIGCVSGLLQPTAGHVTIMGKDAVRDGRAARAALGVVPQELAIYEEVSAEENLVYWGSAYGLGGKKLDRAIADALELVALSDRAKTPVKKFSGGMKRRLNFACGIVHRPKVLLLDEPTVGVDPQSRVRLLDLVRDQARQGACVLYTTHYMEEAQSLCDRIGVIDHGKLIAMGTLAELRAQIGEQNMVRFTGRFDPEQVRHALDGVKGLQIVEAGEEVLLLAVEDSTRGLPDLFARLAAAGADVRETTMIQPSLESLFIKLTGRELRE